MYIRNLLTSHSFMSPLKTDFALSPHPGSWRVWRVYDGFPDQSLIDFIIHLAWLWLEAEALGSTLRLKESDPFPFSQQCLGPLGLDGQFLFIRHGRHDPTAH
jgi:hypothetical protein